MDQQIPEVKAEVNKEEERDRKGGGFWGNLSSKLGGNFSGATGGTGTGLGGLLGGGVLATKAGLVGLILVGTTVAGGLGLVGYKVMGGGSSGDGEGTYSIFEAKPKGAEGSEASASSAKGDGTSDSLNMFAKANLGQESKSEEAPAEATPAEPVVNTVPVRPSRPSIMDRPRHRPRPSWAAVPGSGLCPPGEAVREAVPAPPRRGPICRAWWPPGTGEAFRG